MASFRLQRGTVRGSALGLAREEPVVLDWAGLLARLDATPATHGYRTLAQLRPGKVVLRTDAGLVVAAYEDVRDAIPPGTRAVYKVLDARYDGTMRRGTA